MRIKRRFASPGDYCRPLPLDLSRAEVIHLHWELLDRIEAHEKKGESIYSLNALAEKLEAALRAGETSKP